MKEINALGEKESSKSITMLVNLGDYNANNDSSKENELFGARKLNQKQIIPGILDETTGQYTFRNAPNLNKAIIAMRKTSNGEEIPVVHNFELSAEESGSEYLPCEYCFKYLKK